jgi:hypothetical protein
MNQQAINAHHIARHLRAIANILRSAERPLTDEAEEVLSFDLANLTKLYTELAEDLEATAPFTPLTDVEKDKVLGLIADDVAERAELLTADWTEADWRIEYDQLEEYMSEDE